MYVGVLAVGLYVSHFVIQIAMIVLIAILVAFAAMDGMILSQVHRLQAAPIDTASDLHATREEMKRLARIVMAAGGVLGVAFAGLLTWMILHS